MNKKAGFFCLASFCFVVVLLSANQEIESEPQVGKRLFDKLDRSPHPEVVTIDPESKIVEQAEGDEAEKELIAKAMAQMALVHERTFEYPSYSEPISDPDSPYLNWNQFIEVAIPILNGEFIASLNMEKYRYFYSEPIKLELKTNADFIHATLDAVSVSTQEVLGSYLSDKGQWQVYPERDWPEEVRFIARLDSEQGSDIVSADIRIYNSIAHLVSVGQSFAVGPDMTVPVTLNVDEAGIYRLRANLYNVDGQPIATLVQKKRLAVGEQIVELKAFKAVLPTGVSDLELRHFMIERMSGFPGQRAGYGNSGSGHYQVGSFDSDSLTDEPYQPSLQEQKQAAFLRSLL